MLSSLHVFIEYKVFHVPDPICFVANLCDLLNSSRGSTDVIQEAWELFVNDSSFTIFPWLAKGLGGNDNLINTHLTLSTKDSDSWIHKSNF